MKNNDTTLTLRTSGGQHLRFEANKLVKDIWETDGEVIVIDNDLNEYKEYYVLGKKVDWAEYKKNRPEDRLNMTELKKMRQSFTEY